MMPRDLAFFSARKRFASVKYHGVSERGRVIPLSLVALGVVFGDIGTSPLYAFKECLRHGAASADVYGTVSLILWSLILLVSIKYVGIVLRADNDGERGILALLALAFPEKNRKSGINAASIMTAFGVFGAALLYGDGVITPAISVLSAVEGLNTVSPLLDKVVVPLTICILVALFSIQRFGTSAVGGMFGKVMLLWFLILGATGFLHIWRQPTILAALNPFVGLHYLFTHGLRSITVLGRIFGGYRRRGLIRGHGTPVALLNNLKHNRVIHERNILLTFLTERAPYLADGKPRLEITVFSERFFRIIAHFGYMEIPTIDKIAEAARAQLFDLRPDKTTFFLGRETLVLSKGKGLSRLRRKVFRLMSRNAENAADFFQLPGDRTIEIGFPVEL